MDVPQHTSPFVDVQGDKHSPDKKLGRLFASLPAASGIRRTMRPTLAEVLIALNSTNADFKAALPSPTDRNASQANLSSAMDLSSYRRFQNAHHINADWVGTDGRAYPAMLPRQYRPGRAIGGEARRGGRRFQRFENAQRQLQALGNLRHYWRQ